MNGNQLEGPVNDDESPELPDAIYQRVTELSEKANEAIESGRPQNAIAPLEQALELLPSPQSDWEAWTWLNASLGQAYFDLQDFQLAKISFLDARSGPDGLANPYILLRLGECLFELGDHDAAKNFLTQAYMTEGVELFSDENPKYIAFLRQ
ncbi:MAG: tetratricopeptide repeat protein [Betaproteobacteria bacterium]|nr:tetratricopeptide repeat protein [Betaproteobacteria bacterium]